MLITTCTHCLARFRVTPQQLNARQGQVRCGRCGKIFSGFEALERVPDDDIAARPLAPRQPDEARAPRSERPANAGSDEPPELDAYETPPGSGPDTREAAAGPAGTRPASVPRAVPARPAAFVPLPEAEPPPRVSRAWSFAALLLLLMLACELAYALRSPLAQRYPVLRPWLESACDRLGCAVAWPHDERLLKLEDSELLEVPGHAGQIALGARIRNLADGAQAYPYIELTLTDISGQPAARRVLRPADYLGHAPRRDEVLAAGAQIAIELRLETPGLKPTGYELLLFYP